MVMFLEVSKENYNITIDFMREVQILLEHFMGLIK